LTRLQVTRGGGNRWARRDEVSAGQSGVAEGQRHSSASGRGSGDAGGSFAVRCSARRGDGWENRFEKPGGRAQLVSVPGRGRKPVSRRSWPSKARGPGGRDLGSFRAMGQQTATPQSAPGQAGTDGAEGGPRGPGDKVLQASRTGQDAGTGRQPGTGHRRPGRATCTGGTVEKAVLGGVPETRSWAEGPGASKATRPVAGCQQGGRKHVSGHCLDFQAPQRENTDQAGRKPHQKGHGAVGLEAGWGGGDAGNTPRLSERDRQTVMPGQAGADPTNWGVEDNTGAGAGANSRRPHPGSGEWGPSGRPGASAVEKPLADGGRPPPEGPGRGTVRAGQGRGVRAESPRRPHPGGRFPVDGGPSRRDQWEGTPCRPWPRPDAAKHGLLCRRPGAGRGAPRWPGAISLPRQGAAGV